MRPSGKLHCVLIKTLIIVRTMLTGLGLLVMGTDITALSLD